MEPSNRPYAGPPPHALRMGDVLGGRFRILRLIGAGGMGEVYEAADQELGVSVALKTIRYDRLGASEDTLERFRQEAKLARQVTHPNVCRIFDVGRDGDRLYLTMELIQGETLAGMMQREGPMQADAALALARQMAAGLDALHAQGLVHRDFKPANVLIAESRGERRAVITDFGLTRVRDETVTMVAPGIARLAGTPDYMAPEQLLGKTLTPATDVYALGLVLYEMVTGARAYPGGGMLENTAQRLAQAPDPPSSHDPQVPRHWDKVILRCLERDPAARPASAGAVAAALAGAKPGGGPPEAPALAAGGCGCGDFAGRLLRAPPPPRPAGGAGSCHLRAAPTRHTAKRRTRSTTITGPTALRMPCACSRPR